MSVRYFSLIVGIVYTALGLLGFFPNFVEPSQAIPEIMIQVGVGTTSGFGYLFGLLPTTTVTNIFNLIVGIIGIASYLGTEPVARLFADTLAIWFTLLAILGLIPIANSVFGLIPIYGNDVWLHLATAVPAIYFGFFLDRGRLRQKPLKSTQMS